MYVCACLVEPGVVVGMLEGVVTSLAGEAAKGIVGFLGLGFDDGFKALDGERGVCGAVSEGPAEGVVGGEGQLLLLLPGFFGCCSSSCALFEDDPLPLSSDLFGVSVPSCDLLRYLSPSFFPFSSLLVLLPPCCLSP